jgi:hypothetical protein
MTGGEPSYLTNNRAFIQNYGERYRKGKIISTGFTESAVNQVVSNRFVWKPHSLRFFCGLAVSLIHVRLLLRNTLQTVTMHMLRPVATDNS